MRACAHCGTRLAAFARDDEVGEAVAALEAAVSREPPAWYARRSVISSLAVFAACAVVLAVFARPVPPDEPNEIDERRKGRVGLEAIVRDLAGRVRDVAPADLLYPQEASRFRGSVARPGFLTILGIAKAAP